MWGAGRRGAHILWSPSLRRGRAVSKESGRVTELHRPGRQGRTCHCYPVRQILLLSPPEGKGAAGRENRVPTRRHSVCITAGARAGGSGTARPEPWWPPQQEGEAQLPPRPRFLTRRDISTALSLFHTVTQRHANIKTRAQGTHVEVMVRKRSCPAVSQICSFTFSPLISTVRILKSTPIVVM